MIKVRFDLNYVGCYEIVEFDDDTTEEELEELAVDFFWENFHGSYDYEIIEE